MKTSFVPMSLDIETTGLTYADDVLSIGVAYRADDGEIVKEAWPLTAYDLFHSGLTIPQMRAKLLPLVKRATIIFGHNFAFDLSYLFKLGILLPDEIKGKIFDTLSTARMTDSYARVNLVAVCEHFGIGDPAWVAAKANRKNIKKQDVQTLLAYQEKDCLYQLLAGEAMYTRGTQIYTHDFLMRESDFCRVVAQMRVYGQGLDVEKTKAMIESEMATRQRLNREVLFPNRIPNVNADKDILRFLNKNELVPQSFSKKGNVELDKNALRTLGKGASPEVRAVIDCVIRVREAEKRVNTWLVPFLDYAREDGRVHANFTVAGAVSYRITCSNPGLLAIPDMDIWEDRLAADYSQAEYRIAAMYARFNELAEGYARGLDAHDNTALKMLGRAHASDNERKVYGKVPNFAILYGAGKEKVADGTGLSLPEVDKLRTKMKREMKPLFTLFYDVKKRWEDEGYIKLWTGKRIYSVGWDKRSYKALNQLCQGGVAELTKEAMLKFDALGVPMINQVYDALYFPPVVDRELIRDVMSHTLHPMLENKTTPPIQMKVDIKMKPHERLDSDIDREEGDETYTDDSEDETQTNQLAYA